MLLRALLCQLTCYSPESGNKNNFRTNWSKKQDTKVAVSVKVLAIIEHGAEQPLRRGGLITRFIKDTERVNGAIPNGIVIRKASERRAIAMPR